MSAANDFNDTYTPEGVCQPTLRHDTAWKTKDSLPSNHQEDIARVILKSFKYIGRNWQSEKSKSAKLSSH